MPRLHPASRRAPVAVIDIGSNSARVMAFERDASDHLRLLASSRAALRLVHDVDEYGRLNEATMAGAMEALRDFKAIAIRAGAKGIHAVATAAMRDASNGDQFTTRVYRELGIRIRIIEGLEEARYGLAGAVRGLPISSGLLFDLGGGSLQISRFTRRRLIRAVSVPLGALRVSERFLESDPPSRKQLRRLRDHVRSVLASTRMGRLAAGERLVGTGGTLRNLAKIDDHDGRDATGRVHGYMLSVHRVGETVERLAATRQRKRDEIPGLSAERADSIVGGAVVIQTLGETQTFERPRSWYRVRACAKASRSHCSTCRLDRPSWSEKRRSRLSSPDSPAGASAPRRGAVRSWRRCAARLSLAPMPASRAPWIMPREFWTSAGASMCSTATSTSPTSCWRPISPASHVPS